MRGWLVGMLLVAGVGHAYETGGIARMLQGDTSSVGVEELRRALAEREATIQTLKQRLEALEQEKDYARAEALGVVKAVRTSGLPRGQQRRLALAIVREADRNGLDPLLVVSVIRTESGFNPYAVSRVGAMGLMQVMPDTGRWLMKRRGETLPRASHLFDAELNVELGTAYLAQLVGKFGSVERALVAYNAGPAAAKRILASHTRRAKFVAGYPRKVVREFQRLKAEQQAELARQVAERGVVPTS